MFTSFFSLSRGGGGWKGCNVDKRERLVLLQVDIISYSYKFVHLDGFVLFSFTTFRLEMAFDYNLSCRGVISRDITLVLTRDITKC